MTLIETPPERHLQIVPDEATEQLVALLDLSATGTASLRVEVDPATLRLRCHLTTPHGAMVGATGAVLDRAARSTRVLATVFLQGRDDEGLPTAAEATIAITWSPDEYDHSDHFEVAGSALVVDDEGRTIRLGAARYHPEHRYVPPPALRFPVVDVTDDAPVSLPAS